MKRVFIVSSHALFSKGVETLLLQQQGFEIVGRESDIEKAIFRLKELHPDVVILETSVAERDYDPIRPRILKECQGVNLVVLNLENNTLGIYREEMRTCRAVDDLVQAIESIPQDPERSVQGISNPAPNRNAMVEKGGQSAPKP